MLEQNTQNREPKEDKLDTSECRDNFITLPDPLLEYNRPRESFSNGTLWKVSQEKQIVQRVTSVRTRLQTQTFSESEFDKYGPGLYIRVCNT